MKLIDLLKNIEVKEIVGDIEKDIQYLSQDSRDRSFEHGMYFAISGTQVDGHSFIDDAISKGATSIVCEELPHIDFQNNNITYIVVENSRKSVGKIASNFYNNPSQKLTVIAVTGTNGKTSIATYMAQALKKLNQKPLLLSTAGDYYVGSAISVDRRAPSSLETIELHKILREYLDQGATHVCLEATSQGLDQDRLSGLDIDVAIFANLGRDHLDYHGTIENYGSSKKLLFDNLKASALAITNYDDDYGQKIVSDTSAHIISYGSHTDYDYSFTVEGAELGSIDVSFNELKLRLPIIGKFNVYNILSVYAALIELKYDLDDISTGLESLDGVPGRMQRVENDLGILALVDYAHDPGALTNVLETLAVLPHNKITTIIGCGGDRDRTKRAPMVSVTQRLSDIAIYTADNPRTEDLSQIFSDMKTGINLSRNNYQFIDNREEAIRIAVSGSGKGDIILVAGKGHEDYQILGTKKIHFDDREILEKYLNQKLS